MSGEKNKSRFSQGGDIYDLRKEKNFVVAGKTVIILPVSKRETGTKKPGQFDRPDSRKTFARRMSLRWQGESTKSFKILQRKQSANDRDSRITRGNG